MWRDRITCGWRELGVKDTAKCGRIELGVKEYR